MKEQNNRDRDWDDGRVVAPMTGEELPAYRRAIPFKKPKKDEKNGGDTDVEVTKKERRAMIRAMFQSLLPAFLITIAGFALAALVLFLWLR